MNCITANVLTLTGHLGPPQQDELHNSRYCDINRKPKKLGPPQGDELELVGEEQPPAQEERPNDESESDSESIPDLSRESGLRFHLKKRSELLESYKILYGFCDLFLCIHLFFLT